MSTKAQLLTGVRLRLNDLSTTSPRWSSDELNAYLVDAARDYSKYFPRKREQEFTTDGDDERYDVPSDLIDDQIIKIQLIDPETDTTTEIPHKSLRLRGSTRFWEVVGEELVFGWVPDTGLTVVVRYNAVHDMPDDGPSTIPTEDEDLIYTYVMATAWQRIGGNDAGLSRWTEDQKRNDSPIIPHYVQLWSRYNTLVEQKQSTPHFYRRVRTRGNWRD